MHYWRWSIIGASWVFTCDVGEVVGRFIFIGFDNIPGAVHAINSVSVNR
jgi:hypothetical protein